MRSFTARLLGDVHGEVLNGGGLDDDAVFLMGFTRTVLRAQTDDLLEWGVRVNWVGRTPRLWKSVLSEVRRSLRDRKSVV